MPCDVDGRSIVDRWERIGHRARGAGGASPLSAPPPRCLRGLGPQLVRVREEGRQSAGMDEHPASRGDATRAHMDDEARHRLAAAGRLTGGARAQV